MIDGIDVSEWTDEEVKYKFAKHSPKAIRQIAFDLYKQLKRKEQECEDWQKELDKTHLLMLERQDELIKEFFNNEQLKKTNEELKNIIKSLQNK